MGRQNIADGTLKGFNLFPQPTIQFIRGNYEVANLTFMVLGNTHFSPIGFGNIQKQLGSCEGNQFLVRSLENHSCIAYDEKKVWNGMIHTSEISRFVLDQC